MAPNTKFYLGLGLAVFTANAAYHVVDDRISNVEEEVRAIHSDVSDIKAVLEAKPVAIKYNKNDVECLARNIYYEAGIEPMEGKIAVGTITVNRVKTRYWGTHICDVVYSKEQFSWTKERKRGWAQLKGPAWADSKAAAEAVLKGGIRVKQLKSALFYHATYIKDPYWVDQKHFVMKIGKHKFYNLAKT